MRYDMTEGYLDRRDFLRLAAATAAFDGLLPRNAAQLLSRMTSEAAAQSRSDLCFMTARELASAIQSRQLSAREVMTAHLSQIGRLNPRLNAIVAKLDDDRCLALADAADQKLASRAVVGPLHGLPIAFKDLQPAVGFPWTRGSSIYRTAMPTEDSAFVARLRNAGALPIGKTNVPEFGLGSHTYNKVYGTTVNPHDPTKTAGGSSGGAAAALAAGLLPIADGSDFGGSLRNPANFNNVVGMRPTVGLVPIVPNAFPLLGFVVGGPMGRTVGDVAFLLSVMAGPDARDPGSYPSDPSVFRGNLDRSFTGVRVAWCPDLGSLPVDSRVRTVLDAHCKTFEGLGCVVDDACPDFTDADFVFRTIRGFRNAALYGPLLRTHRDQLKPELIREAEEGMALTSADVSRAMTVHAQLMERMRRFQERYEFLLCAVNQVPPFDATLDWPRSINSVPMDSYTAWMKSAYWITVTFRPAISVPAGFTADGLPVGLQIVGRHREDFGLLQMARAFEDATRFHLKRPVLAAS
jgi:amidase